MLHIQTDFDYDYEEDTVLYYSEIDNIIIHTDGLVVTNIFDFITPNMLYLFKYHKEDMIFQRKGRQIVLLYNYPDYGI